jgi:phosphoglycolate phosphatase
MELSEQIVVSFDLDFTLIDNREGIIDSFKHAFRTYGIDPIQDSLLEQTIGEPLHAVFNRLTDRDPVKMVTSFREYYRKKGLYQVQLYDGVIEVLTNLEDAGIKMGIVTSKKRELAIKLLQHLEIYHFFEFVCGETDVIKSKTDPRLMQFFYTRFPPHTYNYLIVGDHLSDKQLAEMLQCPFIGVLTGQQTKKTLQSGSSLNIEVIPHISELSLELIRKIIKEKRKKGKN